MEKDKHKQIFGIIAVILASMCYGITPILSNISLKGGFPTELACKLFDVKAENFCADVSRAVPNESLVMFVMGIACLMSLMLCFFSKRNLKVQSKQIWQLAVFGGGGIGMTHFLITYAYLHIPAGLTIVIHFTYPVFIIILLTLIYKEKFTFVRLIPLVIAIVGIVLISYDTLTGKREVIGIVYAVVSGVTYAIYFIKSQKAAYTNLDASVSNVYITCFASIMAFVVALFRGKLCLPTSWFIWALMIAEALIGYVIGLRLLLVGIKILGAATASALNTLEPVFASLTSMAVLGENMGLFKGFGILLVLASAVISIIVLRKGSKNIVKL